jgi:hypothetical protein
MGKCKEMNNVVSGLKNLISTFSMTADGSNFSGFLFKEKSRYNVLLVLPP